MTFKPAAFVQSIRLRHGASRWFQPRTEAGRKLLDRLEARCEYFGGCAVKGADHFDVESAMRAIENEARSLGVDP